MRKIGKKCSVIILVLAMVMVSFSSAMCDESAFERNEDPNPGVMVFDFLLIRPFGFAATIIGSAAFIVSLPFSAVGGNAEKAYEKMVLKPARFTFTRPLGIL